MNTENLLIVFVKNTIKGRVKTRLAKTIGDEAALEVYSHLVGITEKETQKLTDCEVHVYFTEKKHSRFWPNNEKFIQSEGDLGARMRGAFQNGFNSGYKKIICIGSDLPDLTSEIISEGLRVLEHKDTVFGPAKDGGYYLVGMKELIPEIFTNKPWSTPSLLLLTTDELTQTGRSFKLLEALNDVDTFEDLKESSIAMSFKHIKDV